MILADLASKFDRLQTEHFRRLGALDHARTRLTSVRNQLVAAVSNETEVRKGMAVLSRISALRREQTLGRLQTLVTSGLRAVTSDNSYEFHVEQAENRKQVTFNLLIRRDGRDVNLKDCGGGIQEVVAFLLRLMTLVLRNDGGRKVLLLDEPFHFVSHDLHERLSQLLNDLSGTGVQFVLVSHQAEVIPSSASVFTVSNSGGSASIKTSGEHANK